MLCEIPPNDGKQKRRTCCDYRRSQPCGHNFAKVPNFGKVSVLFRQTLIALAIQSVIPFGVGIVTFDNDRDKFVFTC